MQHEESERASVTGTLELKPSKTRNCQLNMKALIDEADSMREQMVTKRKEDSKEQPKEMLKTVSW